MGNWSAWFLGLVLMFLFSTVVPDLFVMVIYCVNLEFIKNIQKKKNIRLTPVQYLPVILVVFLSHSRKLLGRFMNKKNFIGIFDHFWSARLKEGK